MHEVPRPHRVSSLFINLEALLAVEDNDTVETALRLGARWNFGRPANGVSLAEYSWPFPYVGRLPSRTGLRLLTSRGIDSLRQHVAVGGAAIAAVDSFHLPYRPAYRRVHSGRTVLVRHDSAETVWVVDKWPPEYSGPLPWSVLAEAMVSEVPFDPLREPVFSGHPTGELWFSAEAAPLSFTHDPGTWVLDLLTELLEEASTDGEEAQGHFGLGAFSDFIDQVALAFDTSAGVPPERASWRRQASLVLRAEISARVYLYALLCTAARWTGERVVQACADRFGSCLRDLEQARDILTKSVPRERPEYGPYVVTRLRRAFGCELASATALAALLGLERDFTRHLESARECLCPGGPQHPGGRCHTRGEYGVLR